MTIVPVKKPNIAGIILSAGFVLLGIKLIRHLPNEDNEVLRYVILAVGILTILLFSLFLLILISRFFYKVAGLNFDQSKLIINPSTFINVTLSWDEVQRIDIIKKGGQDCILPILKAPGQLIESQSGIVSKMIMRNNLKVLKTPVPIMLTNYDCDPASLIKEMTAIFHSRQHK